MSTTRRSFLKRMAAGAAATPFLLPAHVWAAKVSPNSKVGMGFIGLGKQATGLLGAFLGQDTRVLAVCDVDTTRREAARTRVDKYYASQPGGPRKCKGYNDFRELLERKDIDAVCIATPDHWHMIPALAAVRSGKDVYCEKPLTHNIHESIEILKAVDANHRVLQTGSMQRSMTEFRVACELVLNGAIGKLERVECNFGDPAIPCDLPEEPKEKGLDWDLWLGPAPQRPYSSVLSPRGLPKQFPAWRLYREYGTGGVGDWGAHQLDIAQWGLGMDDSGPVEVLPPPKPGDKRGATLVYANGVKVVHKNGFGVDFFGTNGEVQVNRGKFMFRHGDTVVASFTNKVKNKMKVKRAKNYHETSCAAEVQKAQRAFLQNAKIKLEVSKNHPTNFMECIASRQKPITSEQVGARSAICCHLLNLVYWHHQKIRWNPATFSFVGGTGNPQWLTTEYRSPWSV